MTPIEYLCDLLAEFLDKSPQTSDDPHLDKALRIAEALEHQKRNKVRKQFEFNELVEVRRYVGDTWVKRRYVGSVETWQGTEHLTFKANQDAHRYRYKNTNRGGKSAKLKNDE